MKHKFSLAKRFQKWYTGDEYPSYSSTRKIHIEQYGLGSEANRDYWIQQAFLAGAEAMANETRCILQDYAAACSGLEPELVCPDEVFDRAEYNLKHYYEQVFAKEPNAK